MSFVKTVASATILLASVLNIGDATAQSYVNYGHPALNVLANVVNQNDPGRVAVGAVVGGLIGSRFGNGDGNVAASAVGAGVGAMIAQGQYSNGAAAGVAIGGLLGSRFGDGDGRSAASIIGAGLGAYLSVPH